MSDFKQGRSFNPFVSLGLVSMFEVCARVDRLHLLPEGPGEGHNYGVRYICTYEGFVVMGSL
jgi:hypothetical protein